MTDHPEELLAEYVDGTLGPEDRARVDAHVAGCALCREEVTLATEARGALGALEDLPAPAGLGTKVVPLARARRFFTPRVGWAAAGVAAAAAAVIGMFALLGPSQEEGGGAGGRPAAEEAPAPASEDEGRAERDGEVIRSALEAGRAYPNYRETGRNYSSTTLDRLARRVRGEAETALGAGFPATARDFYANVDLEALEEPARLALECVVRGAQLDETLVPFVVEVALFEGTSVDIGAFLQGPDAEAAYDRVVVWVVTRQGCMFMSFAQQLL